MNAAEREFLVEMRRGLQQMLDGEVQRGIKTQLAAVERRLETECAIISADSQRPATARR